MMTSREEKAHRRLKKAVEGDAFMEDWWPGMDDVIYEDENAKQAVESFRAALLSYAKFPKGKKTSSALSGGSRGER